MRFQSFKVRDAKDYIITALILLLALTIMVRRHQGGINTLRKASVTVLSLLEEPLANIRVYRQALTTNTYLQRQNILLQDELSRLRGIQQENRKLRGMLGFQEQSRFNLHPVLIVNKELTGLNNKITIDAGITDSLTNGMPLVTSDGLVGKIVLAGEHYSQVMPFYNTLFRVSAKIQNNEAYGIVSWPGEIYGELVMNFVPKTISVDSGNVVETSGYSNQYPEGIAIGKVIRTEPEEGKETQRVFLEPYVSLSNLTKGFVIKFHPDTAIQNLQENYNEMFE